MRECSRCRSCYEDSVDICPSDGGTLTFTIAGGTTISGRYILESRLGQGGMGIVFRARHKFLKSAHAIKIILPSLVGSDSSLLVRFRQEAVLSASIDHPNVIRVTDFGVENDIMPYLVMEFVDGTPLSYHLPDGSPLPFEKAYELFRPIALGVAQAHKKGIVHRDLKPPNIMVQKNLAPKYAIKVLDFGLAKIKSMESYPSLIQAQTQNVMGSPPYMSPEQWSGEDIDHRTDIYALGVIFFQMLAGRLPFQADSMPGMMYQHLTAAIPSVVALGVAISPELDAVLQKALQKEPQNRYHSLEEMLSDIQSASRVQVSSRISGADTEYLIPPPASQSKIRKPQTSPNQFTDSQRERVYSYFENEHPDLLANPRLTQEFLAARDRFEVAQTQAVEADMLIEQLAKAEKQAEEAQARAQQAKQEIEADVRRQVEAEMEKLIAEERTKRESEARALADEAEARKAAEDRANYMAQAALEAQRVAEAERARRQEEAQQRELHQGERRQAEIAAQKLAEQVAEAKRQYEEAKQAAAREANFRTEAERKREQIETELKAAFENEAERRKLIEAEAKKHISEQAERFEREAIAARQRLEEARLLTELEAKKREEAEAARLAAEKEVNRLASEIAAVQKQMDRMQESFAKHERLEASKPDLATTAESPPENRPSAGTQLVDTLPSQVAHTHSSHSRTFTVLPGGFTETGSGFRKHRSAVTGIASFLVIAAIGTGMYLVWAFSGFGENDPPPVNTTVEQPPVPQRDMAMIEGGTFLMGRSDIDNRLDPEWGNQYPAHAVTVPAFRIDRNETTNGEYAEFVAETGHFAPSSWVNGRPPDGQEKFPLTNVSMTDAAAYAAWVSKRMKKKCSLPTEAQWEYAARNGAKATSFPWGSDWRREAALLSDAPAAVGSSQDKTVDGEVRDMLGNVSEWTLTEYSLYKDHPGEKRLDRVYISVRGMNWKTPAKLLKKPEWLVTYRNYVTAEEKKPYLGFRLVCEP